MLYYRAKRATEINNPASMKTPRKTLKAIIKGRLQRRGSQPVFRCVAASLKVQVVQVTTNLEEEELLSYWPTIN